MIEAALVLVEQTLDAARVGEAACAGSAVGEEIARHTGQIVAHPIRQRQAEAFFEAREIFARDQILYRAPEEPLALEAAHLERAREPRHGFHQHMVEER